MAVVCAATSSGMMPWRGRQPAPGALPKLALAKMLVRVGFLIFAHTVYGGVELGEFVEMRRRFLVQFASSWLPPYFLLYAYHGYLLFERCDRLLHSVLAEGFWL